MTTRKRVPYVERPCFVCGDTHGLAQLSLRRESRASECEWQTDEAGHDFPLCADDFAWAVSLARAASSTEPIDSTPLGMPRREHILVAASPGCDMCQADLGQTAFSFELLPPRQASGTKPSTNTRQHRICRQCATWWRTTMTDSSAARMSGSRETEGPVGGWLSTFSADAASVGLSPRDEYTLQTTTAAAGRRFFRLRKEDLSRLGSPDPPALFVAASTQGRAQRVAALLPPALRSRMIVVARPDTLDDTAAALLAGAAEFVAWPLSPQQVAGAIDRLHCPPPSDGRDPTTGLPILRKAHSFHGKDGFLIQVEPGSGEDLMAGALLLRRFHRGYDVVGTNGKGALAVTLFCAVEDLPAIARRMRIVLGDDTRLTTIDSTVKDATAA